MWTADFPEVATRIVELQLIWLRAAGPASAAIGGALAVAVAAAIARLAWNERSAHMDVHDS